MREQPCNQTSGGVSDSEEQLGSPVRGGDQKDLPVGCPAWPHLHAVGLVAHGHRLAPHVAHAGGLRGLGGHRLWREGL